MDRDDRLVRLIEDVLGDATGNRIATRLAERLAQEIIGDGYSRKAPFPRTCKTCGHPENNHPYRHPFVAIEPKEGQRQGPQP